MTGEKMENDFVNENWIKEFQSDCEIVFFFLNGWPLICKRKYEETYRICRHLHFLRLRSALAVVGPYLLLSSWSKNVDEKKRKNAIRKESLIRRANEIYCEISWKIGNISRIILFFFLKHRWLSDKRAK